MLEVIQEQLQKVDALPLSEKVEAINEIREMLHGISPFKSEPVDLIKWVPVDDVKANDYNPNSVAPPEMELLKLSIDNDGYTQPVVTWLSDKGREVIDGFHRSRVCREYDSVNKRVMGYLPVVTIQDKNTGRSNRMASTVRHNRARGKHAVDAMSDMVVELKRRNWSDEKICKELGMDQDEVLRLCQITGLSELFSDNDFSKSWDIEGFISDEDTFEELTEEFDDSEFRKVGTGGENRIFHKYDEWECYKAGFYATTKDGMSKEQCEMAYRDFFRDIPLFESVLEKVTSEWKNSCEHYLTNESMNRIAWLGQASLCYHLGIPSKYRGGFSLLTESEQLAANKAAHKYLNIWLESNGFDTISFEEAVSSNQSDLY